MNSIKSKINIKILNDKIDDMSSINSTKSSAILR